MAKEYYQMGWTLGTDYTEDYYFAKDNNRYFIKKNTSPIIAVLSAENIVPRLKWTKRLNDGSVIIAQDFENGRTLSSNEMNDLRIPAILKKVHNSEKMRRIMSSQGYKNETANNLLLNIERIISEKLLKNSDIAILFNFLKNNVPKYNGEYCPCHADVHKDNWLLSDSNSLFLVDWEDAILADPAIDVSFILYKYVPQSEWKNWFEEYGVEPTIDYMFKLKWYITLQSLIMIIWHYEKQQLSEMNNWLKFINKVFKEYI